MFFTLTMYNTAKHTSSDCDWHYSNDSFNSYISDYGNEQKKIRNAMFVQKKVTELHTEEP